MLKRFATLAAVCTLVPVGTAPLALADDPPPPAVPAGDAVPPPGEPGGPGPAGPVPSAPAGVLKTPDGYTLTVQGSNEVDGTGCAADGGADLPRIPGGRHLSPGTVNIVPIDKKTFKGTNPKINVTGLRVKFDQCAGSSFIRSYATLTSSTDDTDDVVTYIGVTKMV